MAMSSTTMNWAAQMAASANHRRGSATAPSGDGAVATISIRVSSLVQTNRGHLLATGRGPASFPPDRTHSEGSGIVHAGPMVAACGRGQAPATAVGGRGRAPAYGTASPGLRDRGD